jgi:hypothetical protein
MPGFGAGTSRVGWRHSAGCCARVCIIHVRSRWAASHTAFFPLRRLAKQGPLLPAASSIHLSNTSLHFTHNNRKALSLPPSLPPLSLPGQTYPLALPSFYQNSQLQSFSYSAHHYCPLRSLCQLRALTGQYPISSHPARQSAASETRPDPCLSAWSRTNLPPFLDRSLLSPPLSLLKPTPAFSDLQISLLLPFRQWQWLLLVHQNNNLLVTSRPFTSSVSPLSKNLCSKATITLGILTQVSYVSKLPSICFSALLFPLPPLGRKAAVRKSVA